MNNYQSGKISNKSFTFTFVSEICFTLHYKDNKDLNIHLKLLCLLMEPWLYPLQFAYQPRISVEDQLSEERQIARHIADCPATDKHKKQLMHTWSTWLVCPPREGSGTEACRVTRTIVFKNTRLQFTDKDSLKT